MRFTVNYDFATGALAGFLFPQTPSAGVADNFALPSRRPRTRTRSSW